MDKLAIVAGSILLWSAWQDKTDQIYEATSEVVAQPGFIGTAVIFGGLLMLDQYAPKHGWIPASIAAIIALGYFNKFDANGVKP
jgi:hypothetical protein